MNYYALSNSSNEKEIGYFFQTSGFIEGYNDDSPNSMTKLSEEFFPEFEPDLRFKLHKKAILTDVLSASNISARGFLLNKRTKEIFDSFQMLPHKYFKAQVQVGKEVLDNFWIHFVNNTLNGVNFEKSSFYETDFFDKIKDLSIKSEDTFWKEKEKCENFIFAENLKLNPTYETLDLVYFPYIQKSSEYFISSNFKTALDKANITGLQIEEQTILK